MPDKQRLSGRRGARYGAVQAVYRWLMNTAPVGEILAETRSWDHLDTANREMLEELVRATIDGRQELDGQLEACLDRPLVQLDPMEHAVLLVAAHELAHCLELPRKVVINEAVELAKLFGATGAHRYVNGVLDRLSRDLRPLETHG